MGVQQINPVLDRRDTVGNFREIIGTHRFLFGKIERRVIGSHRADQPVADGVPQDGLVALIANRR